MNLFKKTTYALLFMGFVISCDDDDFTRIAPDDSFNGETAAVFSSFSTDASGDGTIVTVSSIAVGVDTYTVDFGNGDSPITVARGESASYDYPNTNASEDYTVSVTAGGETKTADITIEHTVEPIGNAPSSPEGKRNNIFNIFTGASSTVGSAGTGGTLVVTDSEDEILEFSRLHTDVGVVGLEDEVIVADAFAIGVGSSEIHFDVYSDFSEGIDKLKITLVDSTNSVSHIVDDLDLTDGEWTGFDLDLATDFSSPVIQFKSIVFELASSGTAQDHASIYVDNIYLPRMTGSIIINGDFEDGQDFWKWATFTDGETNPYGSSSDGSNFDIEGNDVGEKTRGAKWSSSQSGGEFRTSSSRYAYQELILTPGATYTLEYQYAISDDSGTDPLGGRRVVGLILDQHYDDGADAVDNLSNNLGFDEGFVAEGKFSETTDGFGTLVSFDFIAPDNGEVGVMFYAVSPKDAWIDNVKVIAQ